MPEALKDAFNTQMISQMARHFKKHWLQFDQEGFVVTATNNLDALELKARSEQIAEALKAYLPTDFDHAAQIMLASLRPIQEEDIFGLTVDETGIAGWAILPMNDYVGRYGQQHHALSMQLLKAMTSRFTSEFGIRFFLLAQQEATMALLKSWAQDENYHVRRLVSEGTRPRLPWAMQLTMFIHNPQPVIELLEMLKDDPEEYVRRSVANNLNDIAKDHPDLVADIALQWMKDADNKRKKLLRHACRTLFKQGHAKALEVFGFSKPTLQQAQLTVVTPTVLIGEELSFSFSLSSQTGSSQTLMLDYVIHHQKKNGTMTPKVFKWKQLTLSANETLELAKKHSFKPVTTRTYYAGTHAIEIVINGVSVAKQDFALASK